MATPFDEMLGKQLYDVHMASAKMYAPEYADCILSWEKLLDHSRKAWIRSAGQFLIHVSYIKEAANGLP